MNSCGKASPKWAVFVLVFFVFFLNSACGHIPEGGGAGEAEAGGRPESPPTVASAKRETTPELIRQGAYLQGNALASKGYTEGLSGRPSTLRNGKPYN